MSPLPFPHLPFFSCWRRPSTVVCVLLWALLLAGCGDVRGETDEAATLIVEGGGSSYLAYQDGGEAWRPLERGVSHRLSLRDPQGRYGVLSVCLDAAANLSADVQHHTLAERRTVDATCASVATEAPRTRVAGEVKGLAGGHYSHVYLGEVSALVDSTTPRHRAELPAGEYDLVATRYAQDARVPDRLVYRPRIPLTDAVDVDFSGPEAVVLEVALVPLAGLRDGELVSGAVELTTASGTVALLGEYLGSSVLAYAAPPEDALPGAVLRASAQSFAYDDRTKAGSSRSATRTFRGSAPLLRLPPPIAEPSLALRGEGTVRPHAEWAAYPAAPGVYTQFYSQVREGRSLSYRLAQSSGWLAGRPLSYTLPDFGALPEWRAAWELVRAEAIFWDVSFRRETPERALFASRSGVLTP
jgi:hypothetical protein